MRTPVGRLLALLGSFMISYSTAKAAVLASHLKFQAEKSTNGGHWRNIKNAKYHWIGIGVWRSTTRTRLVVDFYG